MPKIKTNRMARKKLFPNKKGTVVKRGHATKRHNTGKKSAKLKRKLSKGALVDKSNIKVIRFLLPYS